MVRTDQLLDVLLNLQKSQHPSGATTGCLPVSLQLFLSLRLTPPFISSSTISVVLSSCYLVLRAVTQLAFTAFRFVPLFHTRGGGCAELRFTCSVRNPPRAS